MSFSSQVKTELCRSTVLQQCCAVAEAYGALLYCNAFSENEIKIVTESVPFTGRLSPLFRRAFGLRFDEITTSLAGKTTCAIRSREKLRTILRAFGCGDQGILAHHINLSILEQRCCRAAFLRGAFLAGGSVTDPEKRYHLELATSRFHVSRGLYVLLREMDFSPKDTRRKGNHIIYFKQSAAIEDFLTAIGAPLAAMRLMSAKVEKEVRNTVQRQVNCDTANVEKSVEAAQKQISAIMRLEETVGLEGLPEKLHQAALLRLMNPEASMAELARLSDPPVSKSCISYRLRKLMELTDS